jgi:PAS domain S-box-containing protein
MLGRTTDFLHVNKASLEEFRSYLYPAIKKRGRLFLPEFRMKRKDGTVFPTEHNVLPLEDDQGTRFGWISIVRDITERKMVELSVLEEKLLTENIVNNTPAGIVFLDNEFVLRKYNPTYGELIRVYTPFTPEQAMGRSYFEFAPGSRPQVEDWFTRVRDSGKAETIFGFKLEIERGNKKETTYWDTSVAPVINSEGKTMGILILTRDATEQKRAEEEIAYLAKFPAENPNPVLRLSRDGIVTYANAASDVLLGMWDCAVGSYAPQSWRDLIAQALASGQNKSIDAECAEKVYSVFVAPVAEAGYVNLYGRDITDRKGAELEYKTILNTAMDGFWM